MGRFSYRPPDVLCEPPDFLQKLDHGSLLWLVRFDESAQGSDRPDQWSGVVSELRPDVDQIVYESSFGSPDLDLVVFLSGCEIRVTIPRHLPSSTTARLRRSRGLCLFPGRRGRRRC